MTMPTNDPGRVDAPAQGQRAQGHAVEAGFEDLQARLAGWANAEVPGALRMRLREALAPVAGEQSGAVAESQKVVPLGGSIFVRRRGSGAALPSSGIFHAGSGDHLLVPAGTRAQVVYGDGSTLLVSESSEFAVGTRGNGHAATLGRGRVFAWVAPQSGNSFSIRTPRGSVAVLGTEFDLTVGGQGALSLLVAGGRVRYDGDRADGGTVVTARQLLTVEGDRSAVRTLSAGSVRRRTAWAGSPRGPRRGRAMLALVGLAGMVSLGVWVWSGERGGGAVPQGAAVASVPIPGENFVPRTEQLLAGGGVIRFHGEISNLIEGVAHKQMEFTVEARAADPPPGADSARIYHLSDVVPYDARGNVMPPTHARNIAKAAEGRDILVVSATTGPAILPRFMDGGTPETALDDLNFALRMGANDPLQLIPDKELKPGEEVAFKYNSSIPGMAGASVESSTRVRFEGRRQEKGRKVAGFTYTTEGVIKGIILRGAVRGERTVQMRVDERRAEETGRFDVEADTGALLSREGVEHQTITTSRIVTDRGQVVSRQAVATTKQSAKVVMTGEAVQ